MRRAANSITHNIAEGYGRFEPRDKTRFYKISGGSSYELISKILVSLDLKYLNSECDINELTNFPKTIITELDSLIISI
jgi:four helix bundle protein